jgi:flagellar M-ring protein FliF
MAEGVGKIIEAFKAIPAGKRIPFLITFAIVVGGFVALFTYTNRPNYAVLFSDLDSVEASKITEKLKEKGEKYQLKDGEGTILVPDDMVHQLRLDMAAEGILPKGGSAGFEIFDNMSFGTTEFELKLRYQQALQGELARAIKGFDTVDDARVHIVSAVESTSVKEEKPATVSVVVRLRPGSELNTRQLQGIVNLVSCSVEGLRPENVSVVDMEGCILTKGNDRNGLGNISNNRLEYQRRLEETYEKQIIRMLEPVAGMNNVRAMVSVNVAYKRIHEKETPTINYRIDKLNRQTINESGQIQRLSASVIIDGPYETTIDDEGNATKVFKGYSGKEKRTFENIVRNAIGFDSERGDQVTVSNKAIM